VSERFQILSMDGGGLKGIFTAAFLGSLEDISGKRIVDHFDLIAGTSTGGIIALGLGLGYRPKQILDFYMEKGPIIFSAQEKVSRFWVGIKAFFKRKYSTEPFKKALEEYFGDKCLCHSTKPLIIPSFDSVRSDVYIYKTPHHERLKSDYKIPVCEVALATASAPTYFSAFVNDVGVRLIDGGIWANNPAMVALTEALGYFAKPQAEIAMLSIGTTRENITSGNVHKTGGKWVWREKAVEFMMHGQMLSAENQAFHILSKDRFMRVNPSAPAKYKLDKMSEELKGIGYTEARSRINEIENMFFGHKALPYQPIYTL